MDQKRDTCTMAIRVLIAGLLMAVCTPVWGDGQWQARHDLRLELQPATQTLQAVDYIQLSGPVPSTVALTLNRRAQISQLILNQRSLTPDPVVQEGLQIVRLTNLAPGTRIEIHYTCQFDDPAPVNPLNTDNPGFGVSGVIATQGTLLLSGSGWYPRVLAAHERFGINVQAPAGITAVTQGRLTKHETRDGQTLSRWQIEHPVEGLSLAAGPYAVTRETVDGVALMTFLGPDSSDLTDTYVSATRTYLTLYRQRFGNYPFEKFAVVENFFPTGYGFPSYTLIGGRVLRLPFIPHTSLPHEIAHSWWGNGVLPDWQTGNWSEGLTSYVADHWLKERRSADAGRQHRLQALRNYAAIADQADRLALADFRSRTDPATKAVGYDKAMMVFHMLRRQVGQGVFERGLRRLAEMRMFHDTTWQDLGLVFESLGAPDLAPFFDQWVQRPGAPRLWLKNVALKPTSAGYRVTGTLQQNRPVYRLRVPITLDLRDGTRETRLLDLETERLPFAIDVARHPQQLVVDPQSDLFRHLDPTEIPPTINDLRGQSGLSILVTEAAGAQGKTRAALLAQALGARNVAWITESQPVSAHAGPQPLLMVGIPRATPWRDLLPVALNLPQRNPAEGFVGIYAARAPSAPEFRIGLWEPGDGSQTDGQIRRTPHYGKYSYLLFAGGRVRDKGTWPVTDSPLHITWHEPGVK